MAAVPAILTSSASVMGLVTVPDEQSACRGRSQAIGAGTVHPRGPAAGEASALLDAPGSGRSAASTQG